MKNVSSKLLLLALTVAATGLISCTEDENSPRGIDNSEVPARDAHRNQPGEGIGLPARPGLHMSGNTSSACKEGDDSQGEYGDRMPADDASFGPAIILPVKDIPSDHGGKGDHPPKGDD